MRFIIVILVLCNSSCSQDRSRASEEIKITQDPELLLMVEEVENSLDKVKTQTKDLDPVKTNSNRIKTSPAKSVEKEKSREKERDENWSGISLSQGSNAPCFNGSLYDRTIDNELRITMGGYDNLYVKICALTSGHVIREAFVFKGTTMSIKNIPEGIYYLKTAFGNSPQIDDNCNFRFNRNSYYQKSDDLLDFNIVETYDGYSIPGYHLSLDVQVTFAKGSNYDASKISETSFNN